MRYALWCAVAVACFVTACVQPSATPQRCGLDLSHAPMLRGLRLGMSVEQLKRQHPLLEVKTNAYGEGWSYTEIYDGSPASKNFNFEGIWVINLGFVDGQLSNIDLNYIDELAYAQKPYEFPDQVARKIGLDSKWCEDSQTRVCVIKCEGFEVSISAPEFYTSGSNLSMSSPKVSFRDLVAGQKLEARRRAREEEERQRFRP